MGAELARAGPSSLQVVSGDAVAVHVLPEWEKSCIASVGAVATFNVRQTSMGVRVAAPIKLYPHKFLQVSNFQKYYQGTGIPRDVSNEALIEGLVKLGVVFSYGVKSPEKQLKFHIQGLPEESTFKLDSGSKKLTFDSKTSPFVEFKNKESLQDQQVVVIWRDPEAREGGGGGMAIGGDAFHIGFATREGEGNKAFVFVPERSELPRVIEVLFGMASNAGVKHNLPLPDPASHEHDLSVHQATFDGLTQQYELDKPHGAAKLYTADIELANAEKFYKVTTAVLSNDNELLMQYLVPFVKRVNFYINATRLPAMTLFAGSNIDPECWERMQVGEIITIPRILSTSKSLQVAEGFKTNALLTIYTPDDFQGARSAVEISDFRHEQEVFFVPESQFLVLSKKHQGAELAVLDKYYGMDQGILYQPSAYKKMPPKYHTMMPGYV